MAFVCFTISFFGEVEFIAKMGCFDAPWHLPDFERDTGAPGKSSPILAFVLSSSKNWGVRPPHDTCRQEPGRDGFRYGGFGSRVFMFAGQAPCSGTCSLPSRCVRTDINKLCVELGDKTLLFHIPEIRQWRHRSRRT